MSAWKIVLLIAALAALLWFLNPQRTIAPNEAGVVEINYSGDAGRTRQLSMKPFSISKRRAGRSMKKIRALRSIACSTGKARRAIKRRIRHVSS